MNKTNLMGVESYTIPLGAILRGAIYEGDYHHGNWQGHGVYSFPDGRKYDGPWKDDKRHGIGIYHD